MEKLNKVLGMSGEAFGSIALIFGTIATALGEAIKC